MIRTLLIDDEVHCLDTLEIQLYEHCRNIELLAKCASAKEGIRAIQKFKPDLVFLDIEMPHMNGFDLLKQFHDPSFSVIFTTSYNQYAIRAIRMGALDYLLKPVDISELKEAVEKIQERKNIPNQAQVAFMAEYLQRQKAGFHSVAVPTLEGYELIPAAELVHCEAADNYTRLFLKDGRKLTASRTLKEVEEQLRDFGNFLRVHHSYLVNLNEIERYVRGEGGYLVMTNSVTVSVSRSRKDALIQVFERGKN